MADIDRILLEMERRGYDFFDETLRIGRVMDLLNRSRVQQAFEQQVVAADIAFSGVREEATLGARTTLDVLDAEQELLDARANLVSSEVDESVASYQLLAAMGLMTAQNLGLAVQVYDPTAYYDLVDDAPAARSDRARAAEEPVSTTAQAGAAPSTVTGVSSSPPLTRTEAGAPPGRPAGVSGGRRARRSPGKSMSSTARRSTSWPSTGPTRGC